MLLEFDVYDYGCLIIYCVLVEMGEKYTSHLFLVLFVVGESLMQ